MNILKNGNPVSSKELQEVLGKGYEVENSESIIGKINVKKISCRLYSRESLESNCICFLTKNGIYGVVEKNGNFVKLEGGGYVYLDEVTVEYVPN